MAGRNPFYHDVTPYWGKTSADGNAGGANTMPWQDSWPYQANSFSIGPAPNSNNNARLTWGTQYGFLGQQNYAIHDGLVPTASGWPKKSYSTYIVLGTHSSLPVEAQVTQVETVQSLTLTASIGSVVTSGPAGVNRADNVTYAPAGYDHVYGALTFFAGGNQLDANIAVGAGTLQKPLLILRNYTGAVYPTVKLGGVTLTPDVDYFPSLRRRERALDHAPPRPDRRHQSPRDPVDARCRDELPHAAALPHLRHAQHDRAGGGCALALPGRRHPRLWAPPRSAGLPATAKALSANMTVTGPAAPGFLTLFPADAPAAPLASNINFRAGETRANNAVLPLATRTAPASRC